MTLIIIVLFFVYLIFVGLLIIGWDKSLTRQVLDDHGHEPLLSIIIPVRNEQAGIGNLLEDIRIQSYQNFEVIVVNDNSFDLTTEIVLKFARQDQRFMLLPSQGNGKKKALVTGINASRGEIIVTTDGDCRVGWTGLKQRKNIFRSCSTKMVFGGVRLQGSSFFSMRSVPRIPEPTGNGGGNVVVWFSFYV